MKRFSLKFILLAMLLVLSSCSTREEIQQPRQSYIPPPRPAPVVKTIPDLAAPPKKLKPHLTCKDITSEVFNGSGIEILPFVRPLFFDIDLDGGEEMIAGSKDGRLRLYKYFSGSGQWKLIDSYFSSIQAGAFSVPAAGDIDGDGNPEILVGTGGFSAESGRVVIYRNSGSPMKPVWSKIQTPEIRVGNDATPALIDVDNDNRPDLVVGNSEGKLFLFRNRTDKGKIQFVKDPSYFHGIEFGMYAVPATVVRNNRVILVVGNSLGRIYMLEKRGNGSWEKHAMDVSAKNFAAPSFISSGTAAKDLVISDSEGKLSYYRNRKGGYRNWDEVSDFFKERIIPGQACAPTITEIESRPVMVVGNINGEIRLFHQSASGGIHQWTERVDFFRNIKLAGFSRGIITGWQGRHLLVTGQHDGILRAFLNTGTWDKPQWTEQKQFFTGIPLIQHAAPFVFDIDGDGRWELIVGAADGRIKGFRFHVSDQGKIYWEPLPKIFDNVKVQRFAMPTLFTDGGKTYLLAGQQDGQIALFTLESSSGGPPLFARSDLIDDIRVKNHSSPSAVLRNGVIEMSVGDYDGNLRHYACRNEMREIK